MKIPSVIRFAVLPFVLVMASSLAGAEDRIRILGIGNSFTEDATRFLPAISELEHGEW